MIRKKNIKIVTIILTLSVLLVIYWISIFLIKVHIKRYEEFDIVSYKGNVFTLLIDWKYSSCFFCKSSDRVFEENYYALKKNDEIVLRFNVDCGDEIYSHPYLKQIDNDTIILAKRQAHVLVLYKIPVNSYSVKLADIKVNYINKSGFINQEEIIKIIDSVKGCINDI